MLNKFRFNSKNLFSYILAPLLLVSNFVTAEDGVYGRKIVFGQPTVLEGPSASLGLNMRLGIQAAFGEINSAGGVAEKQLELISVNDNYEAIDTIKAVNKLLEDDKVFALIGMVGTSTSKASQPIADEKHVPFIGAYTGGAFLREDSYSNVFNVRASYPEEIDVLISYVTEKLSLNKIAILYQDDAFGYDGLAAIKKSLAERQLKLIASASYVRNSVNLDNAMQSLAKKNPEVVLLMATYTQAANFILAAHQANFKPTFLIVSATGPEAFAELTGKEASGVIVTQVVPSPVDSSNPLVKKYQEAIRIQDPSAQFNYVSLEGYIAGRATIAILQNTKHPITREGFIEAARMTGVFDIDGFMLSYRTNSSSKQIYLSRIREDGSFEMIEKVATPIK